MPNEIVMITYISYLFFSGYHIELQYSQLLTSCNNNPDVSPLVFTFCFSGLLRWFKPLSCHKDVNIWSKNRVWQLIWHSEL